MNGSITLLDLLLRSPDAIAQRCRDDRGLRDLARMAVAAVVVGGALFGAVVGSYRGGIQILYAAIKVPLASLLALAVCVPAFHALAGVFGRPWPLRRVVALMLAGSARASLLLIAFTPALWLVYDFHVGYHAAALWAGFAYGVAGLAAFGLLLRGLGPGAGRIMISLAFAAVFFGVAGQTSWVLRPYLVRPQTPQTVFLRAREGTFVESLWTSAFSAAGIYRCDRDYEDGC